MSPVLVGALLGSTVAYLKKIGKIPYTLEESLDIIMGRPIGDDVTWNNDVEAIGDEVEWKAPAPKQQKVKFPRAKADKIVKKVEKHLKPYVDKMMACGSYRRGAQMIGDIDFVIILKDGYSLPEILPSNQGVNWVGDQKAQVVIDGEKVDFRVTTPEAWGATILYFTGPADFNIKYRWMAKKRGLKLSEYGLFDRNTDKYIAGKTENDIFTAMGRPYRDPADRKGFQRSAKKKAEYQPNQSFEVGKKGEVAWRAMNPHDYALGLVEGSISKERTIQGVFHAVTKLPNYMITNWKGFPVFEIDIEGLKYQKRDSAFPNHIVITEDIPIEKVMPLDSDLGMDRVSSYQLTEDGKPNYDGGGWSGPNIRRGFKEGWSQRFEAPYQPNQSWEDYSHQDLMTSSVVTGDFTTDSLKYGFGPTALSAEKAEEKPEVPRYVYHATPELYWEQIKEQGGMIPQIGYMTYRAFLPRYKEAHIGQDISPEHYKQWIVKELGGLKIWATSQRKVMIYASQIEPMSLLPDNVVLKIDTEGLDFQYYNYEEFFTQKPIPLSAIEVAFRINGERSKEEYPDYLLPDLDPSLQNILEDEPELLETHPEIFRDENYERFVAAAEGYEPLVEMLNDIWNEYREQIEYWVEHNMAGDGLMSYLDEENYPDGSDFVEGTTKTEYFDKMYQCFIKNFIEEAQIGDPMDRNNIGKAELEIVAQRVLYVPVGTPVNTKNLGNWETRKGDKYGVLGKNYPITSWLWSAENFYAAMVFGHEDIDHMEGQEGVDYDRILLAAWVPINSVDWFSTIAFNISTHWQERELCVLNQAELFEVDIYRNGVLESSLEDAKAAEDNYEATYGKEQAKIRRRLKNKIMKQAIMGTKAGQWSARKSQELKRQYEAACEKRGLRAYKGNKTQKQQNLTDWSRQKWGTASGKKSSKTGEPYFPAKAIEALKDRGLYAKAKRQKQAATKAGKQHARYSDDIREVVKPFRAEEQYPICPLCHGYIPNDKTPGAYPGAMSRVFENMEICSACGTAEAVGPLFGPMQDIMEEAKEQGLSGLDLWAYTISNVKEYLPKELYGSESFEAEYEPIGIMEMDRYLRNRRFTTIDLVYRNRPVKEWVYERGLMGVPNHYVRVYTSINRYGRNQGQARDSGRDAIRVQVIYRDNKGETLVSAPKRVHRVGNWKNNLQKRLDVIAEELPKVMFDSRGEPMTLRKYKGNYFWGSRDYPAHKETRRYESESEIELSWQVVVVADPQDNKFYQAYQKVIEADNYNEIWGIVELVDDLNLATNKIADTKFNERRIIVTVYTPGVGLTAKDDYWCEEFDEMLETL